MRLAALVLALLCCSALNQAQNTPDQNLPELGDPSSAIFSSEQEYALGRAWLKAFRSRVDTVEDPLLQHYLESLLYQLAQHSELKDFRLDLVIVDNATLNAFAVPGGVVGVHNGLLLASDNEAQLASVLGHELAHISQRHFERSIAKSRAQTLPTMAALLAGIVLAATTGNSDVGLAAVTAGQAAALETQLRFSREHEQEADRLGMETLAKAGMDPNAMPSMFENMNRRYRYLKHQPLEFLLTHPLTESRITDSRNRARQYPRQVYTDKLDFQLMKMRVRHSLARDKRNFLRLLETDQDSREQEARRYGIVLSLISLQRWQEAERALAPLLRNSPQQFAYVSAAADILIGKKHYDKAQRMLDQNLRIAPDNYPLSMKLAEVLEAAGKTREAERLLSHHGRLRPNDPYIWYQLAEVSGLVGNILGVHLARSEYFLLTGYLDSADKHLRYAWPLAKGNRVEEGRIKEKMRAIVEQRERLKKL